MLYSFLSWSRSLKSARRKGLMSASSRKGRTRSFRLESLEDRNLMAAGDTGITNAGALETNYALFAVEVEPGFSGPIAVNWQTGDGTATSDDYDAGSGALTFLPGGDAPQFISVWTRGDTLFEAD